MDTSLLHVQPKFIVSRYPLRHSRKVVMTNINPYNNCFALL